MAHFSMMELLCFGSFFNDDLLLLFYFKKNCWGGSFFNDESTLWASSPWAGPGTKGTGLFFQSLTLYLRAGLLCHMPPFHFEMADKTQHINSYLAWKIQLLSFCKFLKFSPKNKKKTKQNKTKQKNQNKFLKFQFFETFEKPLVPFLFLFFNTFSESKRNFQFWVFFKHYKSK